MKYFALILVLLAPMTLFAGAGFDNSDEEVAIPSDSNNRLCINAMNFDATNATGDVTFYLPTGDETKVSYNKAAAGTTITTTYNSSIATDAYVVVERADGRYAELKLLSANATTGVITIATTDYAYKKGDKVYEMEEWFTYSDVGTDAVTVTNSAGLVCAPRGPIGVKITAGKFGYLSAFKP